MSTEMNTLNTDACCQNTHDDADRNLTNVSAIPVRIAALIALNICNLYHIRVPGIVVKNMAPTPARSSTALE